MLRQLEIDACFKDTRNSDFEPDDEDSSSETDAASSRLGDHELYEEIAPEAAWAAWA